MSLLKVQQAVGQSVVFHSANTYSAPSPWAASTQMFAIRDLGTKQTDLLLGAAGFVDMGLEVIHSYKAAGVALTVRIRLLAVSVWPGATAAAGVSTPIAGVEMARADFTAGEVVQFSPDYGEAVLQNPGIAQFIEAPTLRGPLAAVRLAVSVQGGTAPDSGELAFRLTRRV